MVETFPNLDKDSPDSSWNMASATLRRIDRCLAHIDYYIQTEDWDNLKKALDVLYVNTITTYTNKKISKDDIEEIEFLMSKMEEKFIQYKKRKMGNNSNGTPILSELPSIEKKLNVKLRLVLDFKGLLMFKPQDPRTAIYNR